MLLTDKYTTCLRQNLATLSPLNALNEILNAKFPIFSLSGGGWRGEIPQSARKLTDSHPRVPSLSLRPIHLVPLKREPLLLALNQQVLVRKAAPNSKNPQQRN